MGPNLTVFFGGAPGTIKSAGSSTQITVSDARPDAQGQLEARDGRSRRFRGPIEDAGGSLHLLLHRSRAADLHLVAPPGGRGSGGRRHRPDSRGTLRHHHRDDAGHVLRPARPDHRADRSADHGHDAPAHAGEPRGVRTVRRARDARHGPRVPAVGDVSDPVRLPRNGRGRRSLQHGRELLHLEHLPEHRDRRRRDDRDDHGQRVPEQPGRPPGRLRRRPGDDHGQLDDHVDPGSDTDAASSRARTRPRRWTSRSRTSGRRRSAARVSSGAFKYTPNAADPAIYSVSPRTGPNDQSTRTTIFGTNFQFPMQVFLTGAACGAQRVEAQVVSIDSLTQIVFLTPVAVGGNALPREPARGRRGRQPVDGQEGAVRGLLQVLRVSDRRERLAERRERPRDDAGRRDGQQLPGARRRRLPLAVRPRAAHELRHVGVGDVDPHQHAAARRPSTGARPSAATSTARSSSRSRV